jgi:two-component system sensor histidine kinase YesM
MLNRGWKNHILYRLLIMFLAVLIPIYIIGMVIYSRGVAATKQNITDSLSSQLSFFVNNLEGELSRIKILQYDCLIDRDLHNIAYRDRVMDNFDRFQSVIRLQKRLFAIKNSSDLIVDVSAYIPSKNIYISSMGGKNYMDGTKSGIMKAYNPSKDSKIMYYGESLYLVAAYPVLYQQNRTPEFILEIELSMPKMKDVLNQIDNQTGGSFYISNFSGNLFIESSQNERIADYIFKNIEEHKGKAGISSCMVKIGDTRYQSVICVSNALDLIFYGFVPENIVFNKLNEYQLWFWFFFILAILGIILFSFYMYRFIHKPLLEFKNSFQELEKGNFNTVMHYKYNDEFRDLYNYFNTMVKKLKLLIDKEYTQKILSQRAELKQLQLQINPHFLYNSYFILYNMIKIEDYESAEHFTEHLGTFLKYITRNKNDTASLAEEYKLALVYARIQNTRFSNRINVVFDELPERYTKIFVPRLIIQPLIENAFEYGLKDIIKDGILHLGFSESDGFLYITVEDNGKGMKPEELADLQIALSDWGDLVETTALINIHRRVQIMFGSDSGLCISDSSLGGVKAVIKLEIQHVV